MSQKRLSEELGIHSNNVIEYEKGRRGMSLETLTKYCKALKLRVELVALSDELRALGFEAVRQQDYETTSLRFKD